MYASLLHLSLGYLCEDLEVLKSVIDSSCAFEGLSCAALSYRTSSCSELGMLCISSIAHRVILCNVAAEEFVCIKMACHTFQSCNILRSMLMNIDMPAAKLA